MTQPTDDELLQEWERVSHIRDAGTRRLACMRAVLEKWGESQQIAPAEIGDSHFEGWYSNYNPEHKSVKQQARDAYAAGMADPLVAAPATDSYVQPVPDKCDRIVWRGSYYHLPLKEPQQVAPALAALFREALAWGMAYGPTIPAHQWDEMRESMVTQYVNHAALTTKKESNENTTK